MFLLLHLPHRPLRILLSIMAIGNIH
jgi:hypothetical protein